TDVDAVTYISLAKLYKSTDNTHEYLNTLKTAREKFPQDKAILFLLVEAYAENKAYAAVTPIIAEALKHEPENIELSYLAGYANENVGNITEAQKYYEKVLESDDNNYDADRKSTRLNSSHVKISYAVFCLKKKKKKNIQR